MESRRSRTRALVLRTKAIALLTILLLTITEDAEAASAGERKLIAESPRQITCPQSPEIHPCTCRVMSKGLDIVCDHADQEHIENALMVLKNKHMTIYWMKFRNCRLNRIADYIFLGLDVRHLNIIRSNVSTIERSSLSALGSNLQALDLANNHIKKVPTVALSSLKVLTFLNLNYNQIEALHASAFQGLSVLERLSLYENKISSIDDNAFKGIGRRLMRLNLGKNNLDDIPTDTFHPLTNLEVLDLHENKIRHIPDAAFRGLHKLDILKLEYNLISTIQNDVFSDLGVLNSLNIEHNNIVNISERAFAGLESNLEWLELGHNRLDHIPAHALRPLHNLRQLDLDSNKISQITEDAFMGYGDTIKYILLDKNHITHIPSNAFRDLHSLEWLKLSHNDIKRLPEETVQPILDTLTMIDLAHNPLICNCDLVWLKVWLSNPHNRDHIETIDDHICVTEDRKSHHITNLPTQEFNCKMKTYEEVVSPDAGNMLMCSPLLTGVAIASTYGTYLVESCMINVNIPGKW